MGRNTALLIEVIHTLSTELDDTAYALDQLENHFQHRLLVDVGNVTTVAEYAEQLRLRIREDERFTVLNYIAEQKMVVVTIDHIKTVIWDVFGNRLIEF